MAGNPVRPFISVTKRSAKTLTPRFVKGGSPNASGSRALPSPSPFSKQGNVTSGSTFGAGAPNSAGMPGDATDYRVEARPTVKKYSSRSAGFGAVKRPAPPAGSSPKGVFPASKKHGNFGKV